MYELTVRSAFEAAHFISGYNGKCSRLHGHNWNIEAVVRGEKLDALGMLIDFKILKAELNKVLDAFDHRFLNSLPRMKFSAARRNFMRSKFLRRPTPA